MFEEAIRATEVRVPRRVLGSTEEGELHTFSDASSSGYSAALWLVGPSGQRFVTSRTFVAPRKAQSIPRLELLGFLTAVRLVSSLEKPLRYPPTTFWTNSKVVIYWVRSQSIKFKQFVSARVQEVHDLRPDIGQQTRYVPTNLNPADALTKDLVRADRLAE